MLNIAPPIAEQLADRLAGLDRWEYHPGGPSSSEPAGWTCLALTLAGRVEDALKAADWLAEIQQPSGAVGITASQTTPAWPTSLAMLAWTAVEMRLPDSQRGRFAEQIERAVAWSLADFGKPAPRKPHIGHDTTLVGWSWAADTHSWLEPTCLFVMGLQAAGQGRHPRVQEGFRLIVDRLLPEGGCNYGNTVVLGNVLLPHIQPTGLAMMALAGAEDAAIARDGRIGKSLDYLAAALEPTGKSVGPPATASLCYGVMGLAAHGRRAGDADDWLEAALVREDGGEPCAHKLGLIGLAMQPWNQWPTAKTQAAT